jgi:hypothetical protein
VRIVELPSSVPILTLLFGRLKLTMLGVRFRTLRYVWNSAKPRGIGEGPWGRHVSREEEPFSSLKFRSAAWCLRADR